MPAISSPSSTSRIARDRIRYRSGNDIILVITLAMSGVLNTVLNVLIVHFIATALLYGSSAEQLLAPGVLAIVGAVMLLLGLGMYLGRYPRFNSWDLRHPVAFLRKLRMHFSEAGDALACLGFTLSYAIFLALIYLVTAGPVLESAINIERYRGMLG